MMNLDLFVSLSLAYYTSSVCLIARTSRTSVCSYTNIDPSYEIWLVQKAKVFSLPQWKLCQQVGKNSVSISLETTQETILLL